MRNLILVVALAGAAGADDAILQRWDNPKRESFDLKASSAQQAADEVAKRYGIAVKVGATTSAAEPIDFAAKDATFLEAVDRLAELHGLVLAGAPVVATVGWGEPHPLTLVRPPEGVRPIRAVHIGGSRLSVQSVFIVAATPSAGDEFEDRAFFGLGGSSWSATPGLALRLRWIVEPGFEATGHHAFEILAAEDDTGQRLHATAGAGLFGRDGPVPANRDFIVRLDRPSAKAKAIRKIEGKLKVAIPVERGRVEFAANDVGKAKQLGGAEVTLEGIDADAKTMTISVRGTPCGDVGDIGYPDILVGSEDRIWRGAWAGNALSLVPYDADGRELQQGEDGTEMNGDGEKWTAKVSLEAAPAKVAVEALVRVAVREAAFSFKDIPLPE